MQETDSNIGTYTFAVVATAKPVIAEEKRVEVLSRWLIEQFERERRM